MEGFYSHMNCILLLIYDLNLDHRASLAFWQYDFIIMQILGLFKHSVNVIYLFINNQICKNTLLDTAVLLLVKF